MNQTTSDRPPKRQMGVLAGIVTLIGVVLLGVTCLSAVNTAFGWRLSIGAHGAATALPTSWDAVAGLGAAGVLLIGLAGFGSRVSGLYADAKGRPLLRVLIIAAAIGLLVLTFRGLQIVALTQTYGSMLAYYCTDEGTLEDVERELASQPSAQALDACVRRSAQWNRADVLAPVFAAGGDFMMASGAEGSFRSCVLGYDVDIEYVETALRLGVTPATCAHSEHVIFARVRGAAVADDASVAHIVETLLAAGWSPHSTNEEGDQTALELAERTGLRATADVLRAASGTAAAGRAPQ